MVVATLAMGVIVAGLAGAAIVYFGAYNIAADVPHSWPTLTLMNATRARSVAVRSAGIQVPNLDDPQFVLKGAGQYSAMCTGCHLAPGMDNSEIRRGLYPLPQNLSQVRVGPREAFWIIKHGLKMTAMPAWGASHDDEAIWSLVAFVRKLPDMTPQQYRELVAKAPPDDEMAHAPGGRANP
jgi:mono/diheme cytochrome c family protein